MPNKNVRQNARIECQKNIPYIFPDNVSETMTGRQIARQIDGWMDGYIDRWMDKQIDRQKDG